MPVTHYDIDDQWNQKNIATAREMREKDIQWRKQSGMNCNVWKAYDNLPEEDDEAVEV